MNLFLSQVGDTLASSRTDEAASPARPQACSVARALDVLGESWSFLLLRAAFFGAHRFSEFDGAVGAPKAQLVDGLKRLVLADVLAQVDRGYALTESGRALFPICMGLMRWGDEWAAPEGETAPPVRLAWRHDPAQLLSPALVCASCGAAIDPKDSQWRPGPGADGASAAARDAALPATRRRPPDLQLLTRGGPCSVSRALQKTGGYWSFLILREAYFGVRRFDEFVQRLGASRNVVAARLAVLVAAEVLSKAPVQKAGLRQEYRLTPSGRSLFPTIVALMDWGDRYAAIGGGAPLVMTHTVCGQDLHVRLVDLSSGRELSCSDIAPARYPFNQARAVVGAPTAALA